MPGSKKSEQLRKAASKLLQTSIATEIHRVAGDWYSSALILENNLKMHGITPPHKLYYEYKFPGGMKNFKYHDVIEPMYLFCQAYEEYFKDTYDDFNQFLIERFQDTQSNLSTLFRFCICLSLSDTKTNEQEFKKTYERILKAKDKIAEKIRQLNPELQKVQYYKNFDFIMGAVYGFAPEEIEFFTKLQYIRKRNLTKYGEYSPIYKSEQSNKILKQLAKDRKTIHDALGIDVEYFLSPTTSAAVVNAIQNAPQRPQQTPILENITNPFDRG